MARRFADRWPFHTCRDPMELRAIGGPDEQSRNNVLLHVHLEGNTSLSLSSLPCGVVGAVYCPVQLNYPSRSCILEPFTASISY